MRVFALPFVFAAALCVIAGTAYCSFPQFCPLYKVVQMGPDVWYWVLERHDDPPGDLCNDPTLVYDIFGELEILECPNCESKTADSTEEPAAADNASEAKREYVGLEKPVDPDYQYQFPDETSRKYGWVLNDQKLPYVKFTTAEKTPRVVYAKVFLLALDIKELLKKPGAPPKWLYLALEANVQQPPEGTVELEVKPMAKRSGPVTATKASAYLGEFSRFGKEVPVMVLLAAEKP